MSGLWTWKRNPILAPLSRMRSFASYRLALKNLLLSSAKPPTTRDIAHQFVLPTERSEISNYNSKRANATARSLKRTGKSPSPRSSHFVRSLMKWLVDSISIGLPAEQQYSNPLKVNWAVLTVDLSYKLPKPNKAL